ncbi:DUF349 domain-containing protein [Arcticibacterium luteifluviistationis]|uniref:DUF349 domain-containing protein n=1 Tax=Arcticibacterium luteifluviistationis TaxID=1784714 RepID=A0A2Z4GFN7_9BACT|nr:DUF349 domain-containing protein [Arcticibacterium luteifluviistationis]AWV99865.1 DUF349 domain-containing protein [Arcticibacterium luteifluviistationis]
MKGATLENEYAYIKDSKVFLKGYLDLPERQIGEVKRTEEEAFQYFVNRYDIAVKKVEQLEKEVDEAANKGSYLTKLLQLRKRLESFDGIGNFLPLLTRLDVKEAYLNGLIELNQKNNLKVKEELLSETRAIFESDDWGPVSDQLQDIRTRWIRTGPVEKKLNDEKEEDFKQLLDSFYQRRKAFFDEQNKIIDERKAKYEALIETSYDLHRRRDFEDAFEDMKRMQREWKEVGELPAKMMKFLYRNFKKSNTGFYEKYCKAKGIQIQRRVDPRVEAQVRMMKEAERLATAENDAIFDSTVKAKVLLNEWKNIRVPSHVADRNVAERFRAACDKIFELSYLMKVVGRKSPTFNFLDDDQKNHTKYREMENIVRRARHDLQQLEETSNVGGSGSGDMDRMMFNNLKTQKRKLLMKEVILEELRRNAGA